MERAVAPGDYDETTDFVVFEAGSTTGATQPISIQTLTDGLAEPTETFTVSLGAITFNGTATVGTALGSANILDSSSDAVSVSISDASDVIEGESSVFTVTLTGNIQDALTVAYSTADGTAVAPGDYDETTDFVVFEAGSTTGATQPISIQTLTDGLAEPTETFTVSLGAITFNGTATVGTALGSANILDSSSDAVSVSISDASDVIEGGNSVFTVTLTGNIQDALTVAYSTADGTAVAPGDYDETTDFVVFEAGSTTGATQPISIQTLTDGLAEPTETFTVSLGAITFNGTATVGTALGSANILDSSSDAVSVSISDASDVIEGESSVFTVTLTGNIQDALTVAYSTADGTAVAPGDYDETTDFVVFEAGSTTGATQPISIQTLTDGLAEPTETFTVSLGAITFNGTATVGTALGSANILDSSSDAVSVSISDASDVIEGESSVFTVTLTGNIQDALTVAYSTADGTAVAPGDYDETTDFVVFEAGSTTGATQPISIQTLTDGLAEPTETFTVSLGAITFNGTATVGTALGSANILDSSSDAVSVSISDASDVIEGGNSVFTVTLTGNIQDALTVAYSTADGTAVAPGDYDETTDFVVFEAGSTTGATQPISIQTLTDGLAEPTETFTVSLGAITFNGTATVGTALGSANILDSSSDAVSVSISDASDVIEGESSVFTVTLTGNIQDALTVAYSTADGTAVAPGDYDETTDFVVFEAGSTTGATQPISIQTLTDGLAEPTETFTVSLGAITFNGTATVGTALGSANILDSSSDAVSVSISDASDVIEGESSVFTVTLTGNIQDALTVAYSTADGTAVAPGDYDETTDFVVFEAGSTTGATQPISIQTLTDGLAEPTETFTVSLGAITFNGTATVGRRFRISKHIR